MNEHRLGLGKLGREINDMIEEGEQGLGRMCDLYVDNWPCGVPDRMRRPAAQPIPAEVFRVNTDCMTVGDVSGVVVLTTEKVLTADLFAPEHCLVIEGEGTIDMEDWEHAVAAGMAQRQEAIDAARMRVSRRDASIAALEASLVATEARHEMDRLHRLRYLQRDETAKHVMSDAARWPFGEWKPE